MPIFEYRCRDCGAKFERIVSVATATTTCRNCDSPRLERLLSVFAVAGSATKASPSETASCETCGARQRGLCPE